MEIPRVDPLCFRLDVLFDFQIHSTACYDTRASSSSGVCINTQR